MSRSFEQHIRVSHGLKREGPPTTPSMESRSDMDALVYLSAKFSLDLTQRHLPIEIPNIGRDPGFARLLYLLEFTTGVEVGVERGIYSEALCRENPGVKLFCVDAWKAHRGYRDHVDQGKLDRFFVETQERLAPYPRATLVRKFSLDAAKDFADGSLDFVYLDANHGLEHVIADLAAWAKKVRPGGIVAGHDYSRHKLPDQIQVVQAVRAWTDAQEIEPWFVLGTESVEAHPIRDKSRSWFYVKPTPVSWNGKTRIHQ